MNKKRCDWANFSELEIQYHDTEWGKPLNDDAKHFEMLILEGAQAGLSWHTVLQKRHKYKELFCNFDPVKVARFNDKKVQSLLKNPGIIRNRLKVNAAVTNANCFLELQAKYGSYNDFIWKYVDGEPIVNKWKTIDQVPVTTPLSVTLAKDLQKLGFKFVGPTIIYSYLQATGLINDHLTSCFRHQQVCNSQQ